MIPLGVLASAYVAPAGGSPSVAYITTVTTTTNGNVTFTGVSIGDAATDRSVILAIHTIDGSGSGPSAVTVGGVSATKDVLKSHSSGNSYPCVSIWRASVSTGTTADIAVAHRGINCAVAVYRATGSIAVGSTNGTYAADCAITGESDGFTIAGATRDGSVVVRLASYEEYHGVVENRLSYSGGSTTTSGALTFSVGASTYCTIAAVAYAPA